MKKLSSNEMRAVNGGGICWCDICGTQFTDTKILWWTIKSGESKAKSHLRWTHWIKSNADRYITSW